MFKFKKLLVLLTATGAIAPNLAISNNFITNSKQSLTVNNYSISDWKIENDVLKPNSGLQGDDSINFRVNINDEAKTIAITSLIYSISGGEDSSFISTNNRYSLRFTNFNSPYDAYSLTSIKFYTVDSFGYNPSVEEHPILKGFHTIYVPDSVTSIEEECFRGFGIYDVIFGVNSQLKNLGQNWAYLNRNIDPVSTNYEYIFHNLYIPASLAATWTLDYCVQNSVSTYNLWCENLTIAEGIEYIPLALLNAYVTNSNEGIRNSISFPNSLIYCGNITSFSGKSLTLPKNLEFIGDAKTYQDSIKDIDDFSNGVQTTKSSEVGYISAGQLTNLSFATEAKMKIFPGIKAPLLESLAIPDSVKGFAAGLNNLSFTSKPNDLRNLKYLKLSNSLQTIPTNWYYDLSAVANNNNAISINIPTSLTKLYDSCFSTFTKATIKINVDSPSHFENFSNSAFASSITSIELPNEQALANFISEAETSNSKWSKYKDKFVVVSEIEPTSLTIMSDGEEVNETLLLTGEENTAGNKALTATVGPDGASQKVAWTIIDSPTSYIKISDDGQISWSTLRQNSYNFKVRATAAGYVDVYKEIMVSLSINGAPIITGIKVYDQDNNLLTNNKDVTYKTENKTGSYQFRAELLGSGDFNKEVVWTFVNANDNSNITLNSSTGLITWTNLFSKVYELPVKVASSSNGAVSQIVNFKLDLTTNPESIKIIYNDSPVNQTITLNGKVNTYGFAQFGVVVNPEGSANSFQWYIFNRNPGVSIDNIGIDDNGQLTWNNLSANTYQFDIKVQCTNQTNIYDQISINLIIEEAPVSPEITNLIVYDANNKVIEKSEKLIIKNNKADGTYKLKAIVEGNGNYDPSVNWTLLTTDSTSISINKENGIISYNNLNNGTYHFTVRVEAVGDTNFYQEITTTLNIDQNAEPVHDNTAVIIGSTVGGISAVAVLIGIMIILRKKRIF